MSQGAGPSTYVEEGSTHVEAAGISSIELAERTVWLRSVDRLTPQQLERWLVGQRLATRLPDGLLEPTPRCVALAGGLRFLEGA